MDIQLLSTDKKGTPCSECKVIKFPIDLHLIEMFFRGEQLVCPNCDSQLNLWDLIIRNFTWNFASYLFAIAGANETWAVIKMKPNEIFSLDLEQVGIANDAKILQINYTPQSSGLRPIEMHGNTPLRHNILNKINIYGVPLGENKNEVSVLITVHWIENNDEKELWSNLINAIEYYSINNKLEAILYANIAVELRLTKLIEEFISRNKSKDKYDTKLNVYLKELASENNYPLLPDFLVEELNTLKRLRNETGHSGKIENIEDYNTGKLLCAAFFAVSYLILLDKYVSLNRS